MSTIAYGWAPITKVEDQPDGTVIVHGPMTDAGLDRDQQRFTQDWLDKAVPQWFNESGNIREQHDGKKAAGSALVVKRDETGRWDLSAHVVDPVAVVKVKTKTYKGFSIGVKDPHITYGKADAPNGEINGGYICETSLVDRPSNPRSLFTMVKADGDGQPVEVAEVVEHDDQAADVESDVDKAEDASKHPHVPAGSSTGGQFAPAGGTDSPSGVEANRKGAEKVHVSPSGVSGGAKGAAGGKGTAGKTSAAQLQSVMGAMQVLGIKTGDKQLSGPEAIKAVQAKLGMEQTGKTSPAFMARVHELLAKHHADQSAAHQAQKQAATKAAQAQRQADRAKAAEQRKAAQAAKQQAAAARKPAHKGDEMADDEPVMAMYDSDTADDADLVKTVTAEQRSEYADSGVAMPNGDFPIPDKGHLQAAVGRLGNYSGDKAAAKRHIVKRARVLGEVEALPDGWGVSKADEVLDRLDALLPDADLNKYDEADDIKGAQDAIACIARLIQSEAEELALGRPEELTDIRILVGAVDALQFFLEREQQQADMPDERDNPGEDAVDSLDVAGTVKADDPEAPTEELADTAKADAPQPPVTETPDAPTSETPEYLTKADIADLVKVEIAEARKADEERINALEADLVKALAQPQPGGPVLTRTATQYAAARNTDADLMRAEAQALLTKANSLTHEDSTLAAGYRERAQALLAKADA